MVSVKMKKDIYFTERDVDLEHVLGQLLDFADEKVEDLFIF